MWFIPPLTKVWVDEIQIKHPIKSTSTYVIWATSCDIFLSDRSRATPFPYDFLWFKCVRIQFEVKKTQLLIRCSPRYLVTFYWLNTLFTVLFPIIDFNSLIIWGESTVAPLMTSLIKDFQWFECAQFDVKSYFLDIVLDLITSPTRLVVNWSINHIITKYTK